MVLLHNPGQSLFQPDNSSPVDRLPLPGRARELAVLLASDCLCSEAVSTLLPHVRDVSVTEDDLVVAIGE